MKKILFILFLLLVVAGCSSNSKPSKDEFEKAFATYARLSVPNSDEQQYAEEIADCGADDVYDRISSRNMKEFVIELSKDKDDINFDKQGEKLRTKGMYEDYRKDTFLILNTVYKCLADIEK